MRRVKTPFRNVYSSSSDTNLFRFAYSVCGGRQQVYGMKILYPTPGIPRTVRAAPRPGARSRV